MECKQNYLFKIWTADCTQFLLENRLNGFQIFGKLGFLKT